MALIDDINNLPTTVGDGNTGHLNNHQVIHAALKDHETRLGARHLIGTGSPEGRITATIGTQYTDQAATNGAIRWIKTSGTGDTGWRVEYGNTGWRDVTLTAASGVTIDTGGKILIRRVGNEVHWMLSGVKVGAQTYGGIAPAPDGFRTDLEFSIMGLGPSQPGTARFDITVTFLRFAGATAGTQIAPLTSGVIVTVPTVQQWPTILPGSPA